jgi:hypothetical protein
MAQNKENAMKTLYGWLSKMTPEYLNSFNKYTFTWPWLAKHR